MLMRQLLPYVLWLRPNNMDVIFLFWSQTPKGPVSDIKSDLLKSKKPIECVYWLVCLFLSHFVCFLFCESLPAWLRPPALCHPGLLRLPTPLTPALPRAINPTWSSSAHQQVHSDLQSLLDRLPVLWCYFISFRRLSFFDLFFWSLDLLACWNPCAFHLHIATYVQMQFYFFLSKLAVHPSGSLLLH